MNRGATLLVIVVWAAAAACSSDESGSNGSGGTAGSAGSAGSAGASGNGGSGGSGGSAGSGGTAGSAGSAGSAGTDAGVDAGPAATCEEFCTAVVAAQCPNFTVTQTECENFCAAAKTGKCNAEWTAVLQCLGPTPLIACNSQGRPTFAGCYAQEQAFGDCEASDGG